MLLVVVRVVRKLPSVSEKRFVELVPDALLVVLPPLLGSLLFAVVYGSLREAQRALLVLKVAVV